MNLKDSAQMNEIDIGMNIEDLKKLAGIGEFQGYQAYTPEDMSAAASEKKRIEREKGIKPGDEEWFKLWFSLPHMTGAKFRGRK